MRAWDADRLISSPVFRRLTLVSLMFFMILILTLENADQCSNRDIVAQTPVLEDASQWLAVPLS
jgi:hypothetical protein